MKHIVDYINKIFVWEEGKNREGDFVIMYRYTWTSGKGTEKKFSTYIDLYPGKFSMQHFLSHDDNKTGR